MLAIVVTRMLSAVVIRASPVVSYAGPPMNVWADEHAVYVEVDLPGTDPNKLDVNVTEA